MRGIAAACIGLLRSRAGFKVQSMVCMPCGMPPGSAHTSQQPPPARNRPKGSANASVATPTNNLLHCARQVHAHTALSQTLLEPEPRHFSRNLLLQLHAPLPFCTNCCWSYSVYHSSVAAGSLYSHSFYHSTTCSCRQRLGRGCACRAGQQTTCAKGPTAASDTGAAQANSTDNSVRHAAYTAQQCRTSCRWRGRRGFYGPALCRVQL
jgi:hypothetical protein